MSPAEKGSIGENFKSQRLELHVHVGLLLYASSSLGSALADLLYRAGITAYMANIQQLSESYIVYVNLNLSMRYRSLRNNISVNYRILEVEKQ